MRKIVIVINGKGGTGKDTLCDFAAREYKTLNVSAITPIKEIAAQNGWRGEKDLKARKFLSELKRVFVEYNDLSNNYLVGQYKDFLKSEDEIMFVHIREKNEIEKFCASVGGKAYKLLVIRNTQDTARTYGNASDDGVDEVSYDLTFDNSQDISVTGPQFIELLRGLEER